MKELKRYLGSIAAALGILGMGLLLAGCQNEPVFADFSTLPDGTRPSAPTGYERPPGPNLEVFHVGDVVTIIFNSGETQVLQPHQEPIKDDGRITPPYIGPIVAVNKTPGELQYELQTNYNKLYVNMTVTVTAKERFYFVQGEVRRPGAQVHLGKTGIITAISSAGDFTEFANRKKVRLIRSNGKIEEINVIKAIEDPQRYDVTINPGDHIIVRRRFL